MKRNNILNFTLCIILFAFLHFNASSQNAGINTTGATPNSSSILDLNTGNTFTSPHGKGLIIPNVALTSSTDAITIATPAASLLVYNLGTGGLTPAGYYYNAGTSGSPSWVCFATNSVSNNGAWLLTGNAGTVDGTNFIGNTDDIPINFRINNNTAGRIDKSSGNSSVFFGYLSGSSMTTGNANTAVGQYSLELNKTGNYNCAFGTFALNSNKNSSNTAIGYNTMYSNVNGADNTAVGFSALYNSTGSKNTGVGESALNSNTGTGNTGIGYQALYSNLGGGYNVASGYYALFNNTTGNYNVASGYGSLNSNTVASNSTASGYYSLEYNIAGSNATAFGYGALQYANNTAGAFTNSNVAVGYEALMGSLTPANNTGNSNTAVGYQALNSYTSGSNNTANGYQSLFSNTTGTFNTANGFQALYSNTTGGNNTANGYQALYSNTTGSNNTVTGNNALFTNTANNNTAFGSIALMYNNNGADNTAIGYCAGYGANGINFNQCTFIGDGSYPTLASSNVSSLGYGILQGQYALGANANEVLLGNTAVTNIYAAVTGITAYSDARYKTNINENVAGLDFILKLKPITYNVKPAELHKIWGTPDSLLRKINHKDIENKLFIGFIAQDVEKAAKECGFNFPGIDAPKNEKGTYCLRYTDFIMPMVKAVQELNKKLEDDNAQLKAQLIDMQKEIEKIKESLNSKDKN